MSSCVILENRLDANRFAIAKWISVRSIGKWFTSVVRLVLWLMCQLTEVLASLTGQL